MVKLTKYATKGGCACKLNPKILRETLRHIEVPIYDNVLVDMSYADDAGVFKLNEHTALIQTVDFFTPMVDDPYLFGQIAAANALSDVYAMGGTPLTALHMVAFPEELAVDGTLGKVQQGALHKLKEAGVALLGGHTIEDEIPKFGMAVTGTIHPQCIWTNQGARVGDALVLTKPIGTGVMMSALKGELFILEAELALQSMKTLNQKACEVGQNFSIHGCTDITGFGLIGHASEMAQASKVSLRFFWKNIPRFDEVEEAAGMGLIPAATYTNRQAFQQVVFDSSLSIVAQDICYDPQTSGGLLFSLPQEEADEFLSELHKADVHYASLVGVVEPFQDYLVSVIQDRRIR